MNKLIRELAKQQGLTGPNFLISSNELDKFAELIVRECISTIENVENVYQDYRNQIEDGMRNYCISLIKHKFGVEE